jgi:hypothetical protein
MLESPITWNHPSHPITLNDQSQRNIYNSPYYWYHVRTVDGIWDQDVRFEAHDIPSDHGAKSGNAYYTGKVLVIAGTIEARNLTFLRIAQRRLQAAFYDMTPNRLGFKIWNETFVYITCRKNQKLDMPEEQADLGPIFRRPFTVQLFADDPFMYVAGTTNRYISTS